MCLYYDKGYRERDIDVESAVPVAGSVPSAERIKVRELPSVEQMASTVHEGSYEGLGEAYGRVIGWIHATGYRFAGPSREIYVKGPSLLTRPSKYATELQIPVQNLVQRHPCHTAIVPRL